ncbi:hypothetical protein [Yoonia sp. SS1-5]|uniref:UrcA family protein n=1 Tax=Yoonia rhodophyticola TaxID=3137370 RepID=A0AAN0MDS1_9RHOB
MTRLSMSFASVVLSIALAPAAQAYSTEPAVKLTDIVLTGNQIADAAEVCDGPIAPELVAILALPATASQPAAMALACAE